MINNKAFKSGVRYYGGGGRAICSRNRKIPWKSVGEQAIVSRRILGSQPSEFLYKNMEENLLFTLRLLS